jgi:chromosome segregation ATPase
MLKKLVILAAVGFVAVAALKETRVGSYIRSGVSAIRDEAESYIPPEQEIARLRNEIKELEKDRNKVINQLATERVQIKNLKEKADELRTQQSKDKELLQSRAESIKKASEYVTFGDRKLTVADAKAELETGVKRFSANQKSLDSLDVTISHREKIKENLEKQFDTLKNQQTDLVAAVDALEAELSNLKLQQMESKYQTDDTRLAKIKEDIRSLRTKMDIEHEKLKMMPAALEGTSNNSGKSIDDIMAPVTGSSKPATGDKNKSVE